MRVQSGVGVVARCALVCALLALPVATARAEPAPKPTPQPLWQAFPLDSTPHQQRPAQPPTARPHATTSQSGDESRWWIWVAALAGIAALAAALFVATSVPVRRRSDWRARLPSIRRPARSRRNAERGATDVLDDLIDVLRTPFQAVAQRRPQASRGVKARGRLTELLHSVGRSSRPEGENGAALVTLNAWLAGAGVSSAEDDAEVLKAKLAAHAASGPREPDERSPAEDEDVDLLKAKLQRPGPAKPEKTGRTSDKALAAKLRTESDPDKYRVPPKRKAAPPISAEDREREPPSLLVIPSASSGAKADRSRRRDGDACKIRFWRGYVKSRFYAADDAENVVAESPLFRSRAADPAESDDAVAAHRELVAQLEGEGWVPAGKGDLWHELRFRRTAVPAGRPSPPTRHEREEHHV